MSDGIILDVNKRPMTRSSASGVIDPFLDAHRFESHPLPNGVRVILQVLVGSTAHGTAVDDQDDTDLMAIAVEPMDFVIGLQRWETTVRRTVEDGQKSGPGDTDLVIHSLRKYCALAARGNPTILLPLFAGAALVRHIDHFGHALQLNRRMFLSKDCGKAFLGYMQDQLDKLTGERGGRHGTRPELIEKFGFDTKYAGHIIRLGMQGIELMKDETLSLPMRLRESQEVIAVRTGQWSLEKVVEMAKRFRDKLEEVTRKSRLPDHADFQKIDVFLVSTYTSAWAEQMP